MSPLFGTENRYIILRWIICTRRANKALQWKLDTKFLSEILKEREHLQKEAIKGRYKDEAASVFKHHTKHRDTGDAHNTPSALLQVFTEQKAGWTTEPTCRRRDKSLLRDSNPYRSSHNRMIVQWGLNKQGVNAVAVWLVQDTEQ